MKRHDVLWADGLLVEVRNLANPSAGDAARNLAGIQRQLGLTDLTGGDAPGGSDDVSAASAGTLLQLRPGSAPAPLPTAAAGSSSTASTWKSAAVLGRWLAFGATTALLGYLGGRAESRQALRELEQQQSQRLELEQGRQRQIEQQPLQEQQPLPGSPLSPEQQPLLEQQPLPKVSVAKRRTEGAPARTARPRAQPARPQRKPNELLREAIELLQRAEAALRQGDAFSASLLLSDLDRSVPAALLREERLVTRALVSCALGEKEAARASAQELDQLNPQSIYRARLEGGCPER